MVYGERPRNSYNGAAILRRRLESVGSIARPYNDCVFGGSETRSQTLWKLKRKGSPTVQQVDAGAARPGTANHHQRLGLLVSSRLFNIFITLNKKEVTQNYLQK